MYINYFTCLTFHVSILSSVYIIPLQWRWREKETRKVKFGDKEREKERCLEQKNSLVHTLAYYPSLTIWLLTCLLNLSISSHFSLQSFLSCSS